MISRVPTISVVMPVYNRADFVPAAVESVLGQSFRDFEFIIVNDGSTDGTSAILHGFKNRDRRIVLIEQPNCGYTNAISVALTHTKGRFVARMDSDDVSLLERFQYQLAYFKAHDNVVAVGGQCVAIDDDGDELFPMRKPCGHDEIEEQLLERVPFRAPLVHPAVMMRRSALLAAGGYRSEFEPAEDRDLWLRLSEVGRLANLSETVLHYRVHQGAVSFVRRSEQYENSRRAVIAAYARRREDIPNNFRASRPDSIETVGLPAAAIALRAAKHGRFRTARKHARRAIVNDPWKRHGWYALFITAWTAGTKFGFYTCRGRKW